MQNLRMSPHNSGHFYFVTSLWIRLILDWLYSEGFGEVAIPGKVSEAILNGVAVLESVNESDSTCKNNGRVVTM